jgi:hypothetical protein
MALITKKLLALATAKKQNSGAASSQYRSLTFVLLIQQQSGNE